MKLPQLIALVLLQSAAALASFGAGPGSFDLPSQDSPEAAWWRDARKTRDERLAWWREARFGMFVHWGVYSELGGQWRDNQLRTGYSEHIQRRLKIPQAVYRDEIAGSFNPVRFDADAWIRTAKEAGMGYFVITAKHHDGFAMWPSLVSAYNIREMTPFKRDPMRELRDACKKYGLKFGFYYSHAFDWGEENGVGNDWEYRNPGGDLLLGGREWWNSPEMAWFLPKAQKYVTEKAIPQLQELIGRYAPDMIWFDTPAKLPPSENFRIMRAVREASPHLVINSRIIREGEAWGDYASTADRPAEFPPHAGDWEGIPTTNESYGWSRFDLSHKPAEHFIKLLVKSVARGGNLLMNIGPMGDGRIDPKDSVILGGIADWWRVNGESIRGGERTPLAVQTWGESTRQGDRLYLHVFHWPADGRLVVGGLVSPVKQAYLLADETRAALPVRRLNPLDLAIDLPGVAPTAGHSVVVLEMEDAIQAEPSRLLQSDFPRETLHVFDAELAGSGLKPGAGKVQDAYVLGLANPAQSIVWAARINEPATYEVEVSYDAAEEAVGGTYVIKAGGAELHGTVTAGKEVKAVVGRITLRPGDATITLAPRSTTPHELMRPRSITLTRVTSRSERSPVAALHRRFFQPPTKSACLSDSPGLPSARS